LRVRVIKGKITLNVWNKSKGNQFWFELWRTSSYREFELPEVNCTIILHRIILKQTKLHNLDLKLKLS